MTSPVMWGWIAQKYAYVPFSLKVKENESSVSSAPELNGRGSSELVAVCGTSSWLTQVTLVPGATLSERGLKVKLSILTLCSAASSVGAAFTEPRASEAEGSASGAVAAGFLLAGGAQPAPSAQRSAAEPLRAIMKRTLSVRF